MGIYIFLSENEKKKWSCVSDEEINELLQEVRSFNKKILIEEKKYDKKRLFKKPLNLVSYTMYYESPSFDGSIYQAQYCFAAGSTKETISAYLFGMLNAYLSK